jgi:hypothetical protein
MQIEMGGRLTIDLLEESQELVCPMAWHTFADDRACCHIERGEERRGAVAFVIMGHGSGAALLQGKPGWVRSSAWIWLFSSMDSTSAFSGGSR